MIIETIAIVAFAFAATTLTALAYERRMDVLHGSYIEGHIAGESAREPLVLTTHLFDHFRWRARSMVYLTSIIAC